MSTIKIHQRKLIAITILPTLLFCLTSVCLKGAPLPDQNADSVKTPDGEAYSSVLGDYRNYYTEYEPLCFTTICPGPPGNYGLRLVFDSNMPGFQRVEYADPADNFQILKNNDLFVPFEEKLDVEQEKTYKIRPVFSPAQKDIVYTIRINCMTRAAFEKSGGKRSRDITKVFCEPRMNYGASRPENWKTFKPDAKDLAFAKKQWGHLLQGISSDYEKAKTLAKSIKRELKGCGGLPSAFIYSLSAFDKYKAIKAGKSKFACAQYSEIFSKACNCFGVMNRWGFLNDNLQNEEMLIELGSSHLVTEIFDRERNQWIFIDGDLDTLGAYLGNVGPLTLHEFLLFINQPNRRGSLNVIVYDPEKDTEQLLPVDKSPKPYLSYRGWTKGFHTEYRSLPQVDVP